MKSKDILTYLDGMIQSQFIFARRDICPPHPLSPWKSCEYHAISIIIEGGWIDTEFKNTRFCRQRNDAWLLPQHTERRVALMSKGNEKNFTLLALAMRWNVFGGLDLLSFFETPLRFNKEDSLKIRGIIEYALQNENDASLSPLELAVRRKCVAFEALQLIIDKSKLKEDAAKRIRHYDILRPALDIISTNLHETLSIQQLAKTCALSRPQFHHIFKEMVGIAPLEHQRNLRLAEAKRLLLEGSMNVAQIGESLGWPDPFHFSRIFKKNCGYSPRIYRNRCIQGTELTI